MKPLKIQKRHRYSYWFIIHKYLYPYADARNEKKGKRCLRDFFLFFFVPFFQNKLCDVMQYNIYRVTTSVFTHEKLSSVFINIYTMQSESCKESQSMQHSVRDEKKTCFFPLHSFRREKIFIHAIVR